MLNVLKAILNALTFEEAFWFILVLVLLLILGIVKCYYAWQPKWKATTTKDENGNTETKFYHLDH